jgi:hypothetical protein
MLIEGGASLCINMELDYSRQLLRQLSAVEDIRDANNNERHGNFTWQKSRTHKTGEVYFVLY